MCGLCISNTSHPEPVTSQEATLALCSLCVKLPLSCVTRLLWSFMSTLRAKRDVRLRGSMTKLEKIFVGKSRRKAIRHALMWINWDAEMWEVNRFDIKIMLVLLLPVFKSEVAKLVVLHNLHIVIRIWRRGTLKLEALMCEKKCVWVSCGERCHASPHACLLCACMRECVSACAEGICFTVRVHITLFCSEQDVATVPLFLS